MDAPTGVGLGLGAGPPIPGQRGRPYVGDYFGRTPPYILPSVACVGFATGAVNGGCSGGFECVSGVCQPDIPCSTANGCVAGMGCGLDGVCHSLDQGPEFPAGVPNVNCNTDSIPFAGVDTVNGECVMVQFLAGAPSPIPAVPSTASISIGVAGVLLLAGAAYLSSRGGRL